MSKLALRMIRAARFCNFDNRWMFAIDVVPHVYIYFFFCGGGGGGGGAVNSRCWVQDFVSRKDESTYDTQF